MDGYLLDLTHPDPFQKWAMIIAAILTICYAIMRPLKKRKDPLAKPASLSLAGQREVERQMTELLVELEQMARKMTAQLDTRAAKLEVLLKQADEKIAALRSAGGSAAQAPAVVQPRLEIAPGLAPLPDPRHAEVYQLADEGLSARQIARQLNRPHGEVELILALRGRERAEVSASS